jgi:hypothetical protein
MGITRYLDLRLELKNPLMNQTSVLKPFVGSLRWCTKEQRDNLVVDVRDVLAVSEVTLAE